MCLGVAAALAVTYSAGEHFHPDRLAPGFVGVEAVEAQIDEPVSCTQIPVSCEAS